MDEPDINKCPTCGGIADQGFDRCYPPNPYECTKCEKKRTRPMTNKDANAAWDIFRKQCVAMGLKTSGHMYAAFISMHEKANPPAMSEDAFKALNYLTLQAAPTNETMQAVRCLRAALQGGSALPATAPKEHTDDIAVNEFAAAMKIKLAKKRAEGRGGWETASFRDLSRMLREHVDKKCPVDVANFCMMLWNNGDPIARAETQPKVTRKDLYEFLVYGIPSESLAKETAEALVRMWPHIVGE